MIAVTARVDVDRPAQEVFDYISDFSNNPAWQKGMREARWTSPPPVAVGSTYEQAARFLGREVVSSFVVTDLEAGRRVTIESTGGTFPITVTRRVEPLTDSRCRVTADGRGDPRGFYRVVTPVLRAMVRRSVQGDYDRLKARPES